MTIPPSKAITVLTVCTGNVCRSPAVKRLLQRTLAGHQAITISSAGVDALVGEPIQPPMVRLLEEQGVDAENFAAQQLTKPMANGADLILTATRRQRAAVVELSPATVRRTFTLREFARLAQQVAPGKLPDSAAPADRLAALVPLATAGRQQVEAELDDIIDPYRRSDAVYQEAFAHILDAVHAIGTVVLAERTQQ